MRVESCQGPTLLPAPLHFLQPQALAGDRPVAFFPTAHPTDCLWAACSHSLGSRDTASGKARRKRCRGAVQIGQSPLPCLLFPYRLKASHPSQTPSSPSSHQTLSSFFPLTHAFLISPPSHPPRRPARGFRPTHVPQARIQLRQGQHRPGRRPVRPNTGDARKAVLRSGTGQVPGQGH